MCGAVAVAGLAAADEVPRGRRTARPAPTHVVVTEVECEAGGAPVLVRPGVAVAARRVGGKTTRVRVLSAVDLECAMPTSALGKRLSRDVAIERDGETIGMAYAGALVRPVEARPRGGAVRVEGVGAVRTELVVPADALTAEPVEFVYRAPATHRFVTPYKDTGLWREQASVGTTTPPIGTIAGEVEVALVGQDGVFARVRAHGPIEIEGWALNKQFADRRQREQPAKLLVPTHEVTIAAPLYAADTGGATVGRLRGGALIEVNKVAGGRTKITTTGDVVVSGWVDAASIRPLDE